MSSTPPLRKYRLMRANDANGRMELFRTFEAVNDDTAIEHSSRWRKKRPAELWRSYRVVTRWNAG